MPARERKDERLEAFAEACRAAGVRVSLESRDQLTRMARTDAHHGALAIVRERAFLTIEDLLLHQGSPSRRSPTPLFPRARRHRGPAITSGRSSAPPTVPGSTASSCPNAAPPPSPPPSPKPPPAHPNTSASPASPTSSARSSNSKSRTSGSSASTSAAHPTTPTSTSAPTASWSSAEGAGLHDLVKKTYDHLLRIPWLAWATGSFAVIGRCCACSD